MSRPSHHFRKTMWLGLGFASAVQADLTTGGIPSRCVTLWSSVVSFSELSEKKPPVLPPAKGIEFKGTLPEDVVEVKPRAVTESPPIKTTGEALKFFKLNYLYLTNPGQPPVVLSVAARKFGRMQNGHFTPIDESQLPKEGYTGGASGMHFGSLQGPLVSSASFASVSSSRGAYQNSLRDPLVSGPEALKQTAVTAPVSNQPTGLDWLKWVTEGMTLASGAVGVGKSLLNDPRMTAAEAKVATSVGGTNWAAVKSGFLNLVDLHADGFVSIVKTTLPKALSKPILESLAARRFVATVGTGTVLFELSKQLVHQLFMHHFMGWVGGYVKPFLPGLTNRYEMEGGVRYLTVNRVNSLFDPLNEHEAVEFQDRDTGQIINRMWGPVDKPGSPEWHYYMKTLGRERLPALRQERPPPVPIGFMWALWQAQQAGSVRSFAVTDELNRRDNSRMTAAGIPVQRTRQVDAVPEVIMGFGGRPTGHVRLHKSDGAFEDVPLALLRPWVAPFVREGSLLQRKVESGAFEPPTFPPRTRLPYPAAEASAIRVGAPRFGGISSAPGLAPVYIAFNSPELEYDFYEAFVKDPRFAQYFGEGQVGPLGASAAVTTGAPRFAGGAQKLVARSARDWSELWMNKVMRKVNERALQILPARVVSAANAIGNFTIILSADQLLQYLVHAVDDQGVGAFYSHMNIPGLYERMPSPDGDGTTTTKRIGSATAQTARGDSLMEPVSYEGKYGHGARATIFYGNQDYSGLQFNFDEQKPLGILSLVDHIYETFKTKREGGRGDDHLRAALNGQGTAEPSDPIYGGLSRWGSFERIEHPNDQIGPLRFDEPYVGPRLNPRSDHWARSLEMARDQAARGQPAVTSFRYEFPDASVPGGVREFMVTGTVLEVSRNIHGIPLWVKVNSPIYGVQNYDFALMRLGNEARGQVQPSSEFTAKPWRSDLSRGDG